MTKTGNSPFNFEKFGSFLRELISSARQVLVECKSASEWGNVVVLDKRAGGELHMYQDYAEEVDANSSVFIYNVDKFRLKQIIPDFEKWSDKLNRIVLVVWSYLDRIQRDQTLLRRSSKYRRT